MPKSEGTQFAYARFRMLLAFPYTHDLEFESSGSNRSIKIECLITIANVRDLEYTDNVVPLVKDLQIFDTIVLFPTVTFVIIMILESVGDMETQIGISSSIGGRQHNPFANSCA